MRHYIVSCVFADLTASPIFEHMYVMCAACLSVCSIVSIHELQNRRRGIFVDRDGTRMRRGKEGEKSHNLC